MKSSSSNRLYQTNCNVTEKLNWKYQSNIFFLFNQFFFATGTSILKSIYFKIDIILFNLENSAGILCVNVFNFCDYHQKYNLISWFVCNGFSNDESIIKNHVMFMLFVGTKLFSCFEFNFHQTNRWINVVWKISPECRECSIPMQPFLFDIFTIFYQPNQYAV